LSVYDVYGFVVTVEGPADEIYSKDYGYFKTSKTPEKVDLFVKVNVTQRSLPTRPYGFHGGIHIPFDEKEDTIWYDQEILHTNRADLILYATEFLMWWPDKAWLHAGAVAKNGNAYIFTGEGGTGKTSAVLNLTKEGYDYLSDDWLIVGEGVAFPLPKRIHIFDYNLKDKEIAKQILGAKRFYYKPMVKLLEWGSRLSPHRHVRFIFDRLKERTMLSVELCKINPTAKVASPSPISKVFLLDRRNVNSIEIRRDITAKELARKMAYVYMYEWDGMYREYYRYVCHFGVKNRRIESKLRHNFKILFETFRKSELYRIVVPKEMDLTKIDLPSLLNI